VKLIRRVSRFSDHAQTSNIFEFLWHHLFSEGVNDRSGRGVNDNSPPGANDRSPKESHHHESQIEESQLQENEARQPAGLVAYSGYAEKRNTSSPPVDDDEHQPIFYRSPWEELHEHFRRAAKAEMSSQDESWLKEQMELRCITFESFIKLLHENSLERFHSPMAGLKWLVKKFGAKTRSAREHASAGPAVRPPVESPRC
jgi:hypothetical protein